MHYTTSTKISTLTHGISRSASLAMSEKLFAIDHQSRPLVLCVLTVVVGQLAREPDVQDAKGPVCACVGGDDGQGPVSHHAVDLDGAPASTPAFNCPALYSAADFWAGAGPERERGRAICCDRHVRRLQHRRMQARQMQRHKCSMRVRLRVRALSSGTDPC